MRKWSKAFEACKREFGILPPEEKHWDERVEDDTKDAGNGENGAGKATDEDYPEHWVTINLS